MFYLLGDVILYAGYVLCLISKVHFLHILMDEVLLGIEQSHYCNLYQSGIVVMIPMLWCNKISGLGYSKQDASSCIVGT